MKTIEINLFKFSELSENAKKNAKNNYHYDDFWYNERMQSYNAAKDIYSVFENLDLSGVRLFKWIQNNLIHEFTSVKKYVFSENAKNNSYYTHKRKKYKDEKKVRYSHINYKTDFCITGYYDDYSFFEDLTEFLNKPDKYTSSNDLYNTDLSSIFERLTENEHNNFFEDYNFSEHCDANDYYFYENGQMY